jgi:hypothetical protein
VRAEGAFVAREARVATAVPPHAWRVVFDAHTGRLVETRDELRHADVIGNVSAGVLDYPGGAFQVLPARSLRVSVVNTLETGFTDAVGDFQIPHMGTSPVALTGRFLGVWAVVNDQSGNGNLSFTLSATPGLVRNVFLNPLSGAEYETAEASAYHWTTTTRWALAGPLPSFTGLASLPVNVNLANTCNAYWNGSSINFFRSGGGCPNSATEDIVAHEYGHGFHDWFHGSTSPGGFSEGIGDHVAYYRTGSREVGRGFFGPGSRLRDYRPGGAAALTQWPCTNCEVHLRGQIWAGFTMDLKDSLVASWTPFPAQVYWNLLTITMYGTNPADEVEALTEAYLIDDNDAFLSNGTPRCRDLTWAARRHSLPVPWQIPVSCGADPHPAAPEFRAPVLETELSRSMFDASPALSDDQLEIWFVSSRTGGLGRWDVWTAARPSIAAPWSGLVPLTAVNSSADELGVAVAPDRRSLFIATNRAGGSGGYDIWMSFRWSTSDPWPAPIPMPTLNTASDELDPSMAGDGLELFFASNRPPSSGFGIWSATRSLPTAFVWNPARRHYDNFRDERSPVVSHDGTRLFFTYPDGSGQTDFFESRRTASSFTFAALGRELTEVNSSRVESRGDLTADGFSFYLTRESLGDVDIYRADRIQPVLNGTRHAAAGQPVTLSLRRDAGDFGHIVLAVDPLPPTPIGGVVGDLLIVPLVTVASGVHNPNGVVTWNTAAANAPGVFLYFQGISQDPVGQWYLSDRLTFLHR